MKDIVDVLITVLNWIIPLGLILSWQLMYTIEFGLHNLPPGYQTLYMKNIIEPEKFSV